jgi:hypothetical protein
MSYAIEFLSKLVLVYSRDRFCVFSGTDASHSRRHSTLGDQTKSWVRGEEIGEICGGESGAMGTCGEIRRGATNKECGGMLLPRAAATCYARDEPAAATENAHSAATRAISQDPDKTDVYVFQMPRTFAIWSNNQLGWFSEESSKGCAIW